MGRGVLAWGGSREEGGGELVVSIGNGKGRVGG
jgi:hypothetical protein